VEPEVNRDGSGAAFGRTASLQRKKASLKFYVFYDVLIVVQQTGRRRSVSTIVGKSLNFQRYSAAQGCT
jgi:hypothetical protein